MKIKVLFICILLISIIYSYNYLNILINNKIPYTYTYSNIPILVNKTDLLLDDINSFIFDNYFEIYYLGNYSYKYDFDDSKIYIIITTNFSTYSYEYNYLIKEKEKEIVEVIKEVYIEKEVFNDYKEDFFVESSNYFQGYHDISKPVGTDISDIIYDLTKDINTNCQVSIDYSSLNPNEIGDYEVNYYVNDITYSIIVTIY